MSTEATTMRQAILAAGLKWLFETEQPEGAGASHFGEALADEAANRRYEFRPNSSRANRAPIVVVQVAKPEYEHPDPFTRVLTNGLEEGEIDAVVAELEALGHTVVDRWNGAPGTESGSIALGGRPHPSLLAAVERQGAGCTNKGDEHKTGSVFCGCGWAVTGRQLLIRPEV